MTEPIILHNSREIRSAIRNIYAGPKARRVAIVAYVGGDALKFIPNPKGLELVCWDKEGCTDPDSIRDLLDEKVKVSFAANLHMKVYWAEGRGVILGSANLSNNGLGDNGLQELAVLLPAETIDIDRVLSSTSAVRVTSSHLSDLDHRTQKYRAKNDGKTVFHDPKKQRRHKYTYADWYHSDYRKDWRLFIYCKEEYLYDLMPAAEQELHSRGYEKCFDFWMGIEPHVRSQKWLLAINTTPEIAGVYWSCPDFFVPVDKHDEEFFDPRWPYFGVQIHKTSVYGTPPFAIHEPAFRRAISDLLREAHVRTYIQGLRFAPDGLLSSQKQRRLYELYVAEKQQAQKYKSQQ